MLAFGGEAFFEESRGESKNSSIDGHAVAATRQRPAVFGDKVIGDFYAGSTHAGRYETIEDDEDDETIERNASRRVGTCSPGWEAASGTRDARDAPPSACRV